MKEDIIVHLAYYFHFKTVGQRSLFTNFVKNKNSYLLFWASCWNIEKKKFQE